MNQPRLIIINLYLEYVANTEENILSNSNSKNDSSVRFRQHKRRTLFKIDNILQGVELQQKQKIIPSVIQKSNLESTIVNNVKSVFEENVAALAIRKKVRQQVFAVDICQFEGISTADI